MTITTYTYLILPFWSVAALMGFAWFLAVTYHGVKREIHRRKPAQNAVEEEVHVPWQ